MYSVVTTEHIASNGETIYRTSFGQIGTGFVGQCNYDEVSFLAAYDPTADY